MVGQLTMFGGQALTSPDSNEWYSPRHVIDAARQVLGSIDLDPASCEQANALVKADTYFTKEQDGLEQEWHGRVWLNPPYSNSLINAFTRKLLTELNDVRTTHAIVLVNNATDTRWFHQMLQSPYFRHICLLKGRLSFWGPNPQDTSPRNGQAILYFEAACMIKSESCRKFVQVFRDFGWVR